MLRKQYEAEGQFVGVQTKFNYAWGLIKSDKRTEQQLGVRLLTGMKLTSLDIFGYEKYVSDYLQIYSNIIPKEEESVYITSL